MGVTRTSEETKAAYVTEFPAGTGGLAYELYCAIGSLHEKWKTYRALFASDERIDLLNWAAPAFFGRLQTILRHDVVMSIARLTDPPDTCGRENASLARLVHELSPHVDATVAANWQRQVEELAALCEPVRQLRNRFLAHDDKATALQYHHDPLPGISRAFVEQALGKIRELMCSIHDAVQHVQVWYQTPFASDAEQLLSRLERMKTKQQEDLALRQQRRAARRSKGEAPLYDPPFQQS